ncbi:MAG: hypothetical protein EOP53_22445 [Sphingobacteriales bacterium]|nr:MAG: hypothetical protein EOP53_22445 [Sphingobacteriales bacterium]
MKKIFLLLFSFIVGILILANCKKDDPKPVSPPATQSTTSKGDLRVTIRKYNSAGQPGTTATVNIALTLDSLNNGKYLQTINADEFGYALFTGISWKNASKHDIFINGEQTDGGKLLKGSAQASLINSRTVNALLVLN